MQKILWNKKPLDFINGETVAQTLNRHEIYCFGEGVNGKKLGVFCGIGQCQNCMIYLKTDGVQRACNVLSVSGLECSSFKEDKT